MQTGVCTCIRAAHHLPGACAERLASARRTSPKPVLNAFPPHDAHHRRVGDVRRAEARHSAQVGGPSLLSGHVPYRHPNRGISAPAAPVCMIQRPNGRHRVLNPTLEETLTKTSGRRALGGMGAWARACVDGRWLGQGAALLPLAGPSFPGSPPPASCLLPGSSRGQPPATLTPHRRAKPSRRASWRDLRGKHRQHKKALPQSEGAKRRKKAPKSAGTTPREGGVQSGKEDTPEAGGWQKHQKAQDSMEPPASSWAASWAASDEGVCIPCRVRTPGKSRAPRPSLLPFQPAHANHPRPHEPPRSSPSLPSPPSLPPPPPPPPCKTPPPPPPPPPPLSPSIELYDRPLRLDAPKP